MGLLELARRCLFFSQVLEDLEDLEDLVVFLEVLEDLLDLETCLR